MTDPTEQVRRIEQASINAADVESLPKEQWTTEELTQDFEVLGFMAPYVVVRRRSDGKKGSMQFKHSPRIYFNWKEE